MKKRTLKIDSRTEHLVSVREFVSQAAVTSGFSEEDVSKIALAVDEACTNVIKHAYKYNPDKNISISVSETNDEFVITIVDNGKQFDPQRLKTPDMKEYLSQYKRGGLGVFLMKSLMDKVEYEIEPGIRNRVRLVKNIPRT